MPTIYVDNKDALPKRREYDFYPTPIEVCRASLQILLKDWMPDFILDPGAGDGVWGKAFREFNLSSYLVGVELRDVQKPLEYDSWYNKDFSKFSHHLKFDLVMGNPPYKYAEEFLDKSLELLEDNGYILFLLRLSFLEGISRYNKYYNGNIRPNIRPKEVWVSNRRVSFSNDGKSSADAYGVFIWQKGFIGDTILRWLDWSYDEKG